MLLFARGSILHMGDLSLEVYAFIQIASMLTPLLLIVSGFFVASFGITRFQQLHALYIVATS
jgi:hypothetical protein